MKIKLFAILGLALMLSVFAIGSQAATTTVDTIATDVAPILTETVQGVIAVAISFMSDNLPLIVVIGVAFGMVWFLIGRARRALTGN